MLINAGIPTIVGFGPVGEGFHSVDEYARINSIKKSIDFLTEMVKNF